MVERRRRPCLIDETLARRRVIVDMWFQKLEDDDPVESGIARLVDFPHPALAELLQNLVVRDGLPDHRHFDATLCVQSVMMVRGSARSSGNGCVTRKRVPSRFTS